jgi:hypothetical protein
MPVNNHVIVKDDDSYIINFNSLSNSGRNLIFQNIIDTKTSFLEKLQQVISHYTDYYETIKLVKIDLDRKIDIFIKKMSKNRLLKSLVKDEDTDHLSIIFIPGRGSKSIFNIVNKHNKVVLKIEYSLFDLLNDKNFSLNYKVNFSEILRLNKTCNEHEIIFFENTVSSNNEVNTELKRQLSNFNKMVTNLGINVVIISNSIIETELIDNRFKYSLLIRYVIGHGKVSVELPNTSYISHNIQNFYKKMDYLWDQKKITDLVLLMSLKRIIQRWFKTIEIINTHLKLQPENSFEVGFDNLRLYLNNDKIFIKITNDFNLQAIKEQYIYTEETKNDPLYKIKDYINNEKEILLLLDMLKI